jgi:rubredoxin
VDEREPGDSVKTLGAMDSTAPTNQASSARYECRICWTVYDPAQGDELWQVPAGTPFEALPAHWSCPHCAAEKTGFLRCDD